MVFRADTAAMATYDEERVLKLERRLRPQERRLDAEPEPASQGRPLTWSERLEQRERRRTRTIAPPSDFSPPAA
jgi:hypothetical protein